MCQAVNVRPGTHDVPMRVNERRCVVCGGGADVRQTSAHLARVMYFCAQHGAQFHASAAFALARSALSTVDCWAAVDAWLRAAGRDVELERSRREAA